MNSYIAIAFFSCFLSALAQILLKKSAGKTQKSLIGEYINIYVFGGYTITAACIMLMLVAYKGLPLKYGVAIESSVYFFIMVLSRIFLNEKITIKKSIGVSIIVIGILVFSL